MTTAAARATAAADALLAWLRDQPPVSSPARRGPPDAAPSPEGGYPQCIARCRRATGRKGRGGRRVG